MSDIMLYLLIFSGVQLCRSS